MICLLIGWVWPFFPSMWVNLYIRYHPWKAYHIIPPFGAAAMYFYITIRYPQSSPPNAQVPQMPSQGVGPTLGSAFTQKNQLLADSKHSMAVSGTDLLDLPKNKAMLQGPYSKQQNTAWRSIWLELWGLSEERVPRNSICMIHQFHEQLPFSGGVPHNPDTCMLMQEGLSHWGYVT